jgi:hypothetical protein
LPCYGMPLMFWKDARKKRNVAGHAAAIARKWLLGLASIVPSWSLLKPGGGADALALPPPPLLASSGGGAFFARSATGHARPRWTRSAAPRRDRIRDGGGMVLFHSSLILLQFAGLSMMPVWAIFWLERDW